MPKTTVMAVIEGFEFDAIVTSISITGTNYENWTSKGEIYLTVFNQAKALNNLRLKVFESQKPEPKCTDPVRACKACKGYGFIFYNTDSNKEVYDYGQSYPDSEPRLIKKYCDACSGDGRKHVVEPTILTDEELAMLEDEE